MKRFLSLFLALVMSFGLVFPVGAMASSEPGGEQIIEVVDAASESIATSAETETPPAEPSASEVVVSDEIVQSDTNASGGSDVSAPEAAPPTVEATAAPAAPETTDVPDVSVPATAAPTAEPTADTTTTTAPDTSESAGDAEGPAPAVVDGTTTIKYVRDNPQEIKVTFNQPVKSIFYKIDPDGIYSELAFSGDTAQANVNGNEVTFTPYFLESLLTCDYIVKFMFENGPDILLPINVIPTERTEADLTEEERAYLESFNTRVAELPTVTDLLGMEREDRLDAYNQIQALYDEWSTQSELVRVLTGDQMFEDWFTFFNSLVSTMLERTQEGDSINFNGWATWNGHVGEVQVGSTHRHNMENYGVVYCLDACKPAASVYNVGAGNFWNNTLTDIERRTISRLMAIGYPYCNAYSDVPGVRHVNHSDDACRSATQVLVWEISEGYVDITNRYTGGLMYGVLAAKNSYNDIMTMMLNYNRYPNWLANVQLLESPTSDGHKFKLTYNPGTGLYECYIVDSMEDPDHKMYVPGNMQANYSSINGPEWYGQFFRYPDWPGWTFEKTGTEDNTRAALHVTVTEEALMQKMQEFPDGVIVAEVEVPWRNDLAGSYDVDTPTLFTCNNDSYQDMVRPWNAEEWYDPIYFKMSFEVPAMKFPISVTKTADVLDSASYDAGSGAWTLNWANYRQQGATFEVYAAQDIRDESGTNVYFHAGARVTDLTTGAPITLVTDGNGYAQSTPLYCGQYRLHEVGVPDGYTLHEDVYVTVTSGGGSDTVFNVDVKNEAAIPEVAITKTDGHTSKPLSGAKFGLYTSQQIQTRNGTVIPQNALIKTATTGGDGIARFYSLGDTSNLIPANYSYYVKEIQAPSRYVLDSTTTYPFTFTANMSNASNRIITFNLAATDKPKVGELRFKKVDVDTGDVPQGDASLAGAVYGLYAAQNIQAPDGTSTLFAENALVKQITTRYDEASRTYIGEVLSSDTSVWYAGGLPLGRYYLKEITQAPGYKLDETVYQIKIDETSSAVQQATTLDGSAIVVREEVIKQKIQFIKSLKDPDNKGFSEYLPGVGFAAWRVKDLKAAGYVDGEGNAYVPLDSKQNVYWPKGVVTPVLLSTPGAANTKDPADHVSGSKPSHDANKFANKNWWPDGSIIYSGADNGYVETIPLPQGDYIFVEVDTPADIIPADELPISIPRYIRGEGNDQYTHDNPTPYWFSNLDNEGITAYLRVVKKDGNTNKSVLRTGAKYIITNTDTGERVTQMDTYRDVLVGTDEHPFECNDKGVITTIKPMVVGHYNIKEVQAPEGYLLPKVNPGINVEITSTNDTLTYDSDIKSFVYSTEVVDAPQHGTIHIHKTGEVVDSFNNGKFTYKQSPLDGIEFEIRVKNDIYTPDMQCDASGNRILDTYRNGDSVISLRAGALVATVKTDANGDAKLPDLPLGTYVVSEKTASPGYVRDTKTYDVTLTYQGDTNYDYQVDLELQNTAQDVSLGITKKDPVQGNIPVPGVEFTLYAAEDIYKVPYGRDKAGKEILVRADTAIATAVSDKDGVVTFPTSIDLPLAKYYIKETKVPAGYVALEDDRDGNNDRIDFNAAYAGQDKRTLTIEGAGVSNYPTQVSIKKVDARTNNTITGANLTLVDKNGTTIESWTTTPGEEHIIYNLHIGEEYTLKETLAPYGYLKAQDVTFVVQNTPDVQSIVMRDDVPTGQLIVDKDGDVLESVSVMQTLEGWLTTLFNWVTGSLSDVTFEVHAAEDIKAADGVSPNYFNKGDLVATITTDKSGIAELCEITMKDGRKVGLPLGKYVITEKQTHDGYILDTEPREVSLLYVDQYTAVIHYTNDWMNERIPFTINVVKTDSKDDSIKLDGAKFALYAKQDILSKDGDVLIKAGNHIEERATDANGKLVFDVEAPSGYTYVVEEMEAPIGYSTVHETQEFEFLGNSGTAQEGTTSMTFKNVELEVHIYKKTSDTGKMLPGAQLELRDAKGKVLDKWTTTDEPHIVHGREVGLVIGETYTLVETKPADGYVTADPVTFVVQNSTEPQPVEMIDKPTEVDITKLEATNSTELPGAKLELYDDKGTLVDEWTSTDKAHRVEHLVVGKIYTLHEDLAPLGYATAADVTFTIQDTPEVQPFEMYDEITKFLISKKDIGDMEELPGASMEIHDKNGKVIDSWVSSDEEHYIEGLYVGEKYTLHETHPADGYATAEVVEFSVADTGEVQHAEMIDKPTLVDITKLEATNSTELPGAKLELYDDKGTLIDEWTSTTAPHRVTHLVVGKTYTLHEDLAPLGYATAADVQFTIKDTEDVQPVQMFDEITKFLISKKDIADKKELPGASLEIRDKDGKVIDSWVSTDEEHYIEGLYVGETYTLVETHPADGYATAEVVEFTVLDTGEIQHAEMLDECTKIDITKREATNSTELPGAKLKVFDDEGNLIDEWTSTEEAHRVDHLVVGKTYTLHEDLAPLGYATASDVEFTIEDTGEVQPVEMFDEITKFLISKKDISNKEELPGASLEIRDKDGNVIDSWVSTDEEHYIEGLYVGETYTLHETRPADGYATAEVVEFTVLDTGEVQYAEMLDAPTQVALMKRDLANKAELPGAMLTVYDEDGNVFDSWTSTTSPHIITKLVVGKTYILHEDLAPLGYATASDVEFTVTDTPEIQTYEMFDELTKVKLSKKDITTREELPGASLEIHDKDGNVIDSWVSGDEEHYIEGLHVGETYTLHETRPADGYATAEVVEFTIEDTGEVQYVEMLDKPIRVDITKREATNGEELPGAKLQVLDKDGNIIDEWTSTEKPHRIEHLVVGETYTLHEDLAPLGYATASDVEFTIEDTGEVQFVEMVDEIIKVEISKKDATNGDELPGAKLQVFDKDGNLVDEWTSTDEPHHIEGLHVGETYTLHEDLAPLGYATASDVEFTIEDTGEIQEVEMFDEIIKVDISKKDATNKEELPGAKLQVFDKNGDLVDEWTSTDQPHHIEGLHVGETYTLHEDLAPIGYATASDVEFTIEDTGDIQKVEMFDEIIKVDFSKQDVAGEELPGAKLQVFDQDGNLVDEWTSTEKPHRIEGLHVGETYTMHEDMAPLGYDKASDVKFTILDTGVIQKVLMVDNLKDVPEKTTPNTGDSNDPFGLMAIMAVMLTGAVCCGYVIVRRKRKDKDD